MLIGCVAGAFGIDDRRDAVVRADLQEFGLELLALRDVDRFHRVGQAHLFERDADLASVRRVPGPQFDRHLRGLPCGAAKLRRSIAAFAGSRKMQTRRPCGVGRGVEAAIA